jgi:hypothetical protein
VDTATGIANTVSWIIRWASIGLGYIALAMRLGVVALGAFCIGPVPSDLARYSCLSVMRALGQRMLSGAVRRGIATVRVDLQSGFGLSFGCAGLRAPGV